MAEQVTRSPVGYEADVRVTMADGARLAADLYLPERAPWPLPTILVRTPYDKRCVIDSYHLREFAARGYAVVVQDQRGTFASEGEFLGASNADARDGYETLTWLADRPWSNGRIGTIGCSYEGVNQLQLAALRHPNHAAMVPICAGGSRDWFGTITGGAYELATIASWFRRWGAGAGRGGPRVSDDDLARLLATLPAVEILRRAGLPGSGYEEALRHGPGDPWWDRLGAVRDHERFDIPALYVDCWYDPGIAATLHFCNLLRRDGLSSRCRDNQYVVVAPATHCAFEVAAPTIVGERELGDGRFDYFGLWLRWFDHWLQGLDTGIGALPGVRYYTMGANEWRAADEWPPSCARPIPYYLHSGGRANGRLGDGVLDPAPPGDEPPDRYLHDPATPVPTIRPGAHRPAPGPADRAGVELRRDILVYTTPPLADAVEVTGPIGVVMHVASSARDTDFVATLVDVYPDGRAYPIQSGVLRARYRASYDREVWLGPGVVVEVRIDLRATSNVFLAGHRIRLEVASSDFPRYDRNLGTGGRNYDEETWVVAENVIHHSARYPSRLILPVAWRGIAG